MKLEMKNHAEGLSEPDKSIILELIEKIGTFKFQSMEDGSGKVSGIWIKGDLEKLPSGFGELDKLVTLHLTECGFKKFPEELLGLKNLFHLYITKSLFKELPENIDELENIRHLRLETNFISSLPATIGNLQYLSTLSVNDNYIETIPHEIGNCKWCSSLSFNENRLTSIPESIGKLEFLKYLHLDDNSLQMLPETVGNLKRLMVLSLEYNELKTLPKSIVKLETLQRINIKRNPRLKVSEEQFQFINKIIGRHPVVSRYTLQRSMVMKNSTDSGEERIIDMEPILRRKARGTQIWLRIYVAGKPVQSVGELLHSYAKPKYPNKQNPRSYQYRTAEWHHYSKREDLKILEHSGLYFRVFLTHLVTKPFWEVIRPDDFLGYYGGVICFDINMPLMRKEVDSIIDDFRRLNPTLPLVVVGMQPRTVVKDDEEGIQEHFKEKEIEYIQVKLGDRMEARKPFTRILSLIMERERTKVMTIKSKIKDQKDSGFLGVRVSREITPGDWLMRNPVKRVKIAVGGETERDKEQVLTLFTTQASSKNRKEDYGAQTLLGKETLKDPYREVLLLIWDVSSEARWKPRRRHLLRGCSAGIFFLNIDVSPPIEEVEEWFKDFNLANPGSPVLVVGLKSTGSYLEKEEELNVHFRKIGLPYFTIKLKDEEEARKPFKKILSMLFLSEGHLYETI
ncbi:MAG: hypothetical protein ACFFCS_03730 [Candidatus Hodarchaeota archaeon]